MHASIADFLMDILRNAWEAGSSTITLDLAEDKKTLCWTVSDNGKGMDDTALSLALDPFHSDGIKHPARRVGLGLPFLKQAMDELGSRFSIQSEAGKGTVVSCTFPLDNIDCPPKGELRETLVQAFCFGGSYELVVSNHYPGGAWTVRRSELLDALGELESVGSMSLVRQYLESLE